MSEDFFGRPISPGVTELEFDLCEICQRRTPTRLEIEYENDIATVRFACQECHKEYVEGKNAPKPQIARQIDSEEELPETTRPGWVDDFIKEQNERGSIESIDSKPETEEATEKKKIGFSEAPETFQEEEENVEEEDYKPQQIAGWAPKFIQQALFGPNPENWLEDQGGYEENSLQITARTLGSFADHDVTSVKLSAIQCLLGLFNRHPSQSEIVLEQLRKYEKDLEDTISEFATQTIDQIE